MNIIKEEVYTNTGVISIIAKLRIRISLFNV